MSLAYRKLHALILAAALAVAAISFASTSSFAQVVELLYEQRSADSKEGDLFASKQGFEVRWTATGGKFLVKILDANDIELASSAPQSREDDQGPMTGKMPFPGRGEFKIQVEASGPWHVRIVEFN